MGGLLEVAKDTYVPWTGGEPKSDWSGLERPNPNYVEPKQHRPTSITSAAKSQHYRTQGIDPKFGRDKDLLTFERKVEKHLTDNGLDSIAYLPDPSDPTESISVITDHGRFDYKADTKKANAAAQDQRI